MIAQVIRSLFCGPQQPNMQHIGPGMYVVRTQAGFKAALKGYLDGDNLEIDNYPKSYPSVVCLTYGYRGYTYIQVRCLHVKEMRAALEGQ